MRNSILVKAAMLGFCLSVLTTGAAFGTEAGQTNPSYRGEVQSEEEKVLFEKQKEIDQYVFIDHAIELVEKGIFINYTGVAESYVEIGISPYTDDNANYLYDIFGKDTVKIVEYDESIIYASGVAEPVAGGGVDAVEPTKEELNDTIKTDPNAPVSPEDKANKDGDVQIQIESVTDEVAEDGVEADPETNTEANPEADPEADPDTDPEAIHYTTTDADGDGKEVQLVSTADDIDAVKRGEEASTSEGLSAPIIILAIAGGAVVVGGAVMVTNKKKSGK